MNTLHVRVFGIPAPAGSKTVLPTKAGTRLVDGNTNPARQSRATWRQDVVEAARRAIEANEWEMATGPVVLDVRLIVPRPKSLPARRRDGTIPQPITRPDATKLLRATEDALTVAGVWRDDSQVVTLWVRKVFAGADLLPGAVIRVTTCSERVADPFDGDLGRAQDMP